MSDTMTDEQYKELRVLASSPWKVFTVHTHQLREAMDEIDRLREENEQLKNRIAAHEKVMRSASECASISTAREVLSDRLDNEDGWEKYYHRLREDNERLKQEVHDVHDALVIGFGSLLGMAKEYEQARELLQECYEQLADEDRHPATQRKIRAFLD